MRSEALSRICVYSTYMTVRARMRLLRRCMISHYQVCLYVFLFLFLWLVGLCVMKLTLALYALLSSSMPRLGRKRKKRRYFFFKRRTLWLCDCQLLVPEVTSLSHALSSILVVIRTHVKAPPEGANTEESTYNPPKSFIVRHGRVGPEVLS